MELVDKLPTNVPNHRDVKTSKFLNAEGANRLCKIDEGCVMEIQRGREREKREKGG